MPALIKDAVQAKNKLTKLVLVEEGNEFAVLQQAAHRQPVALIEHMTRDAAKAVWKRNLVGVYYAVSHYERDSREMADKRINELFH